MNDKLLTKQQRDVILYAFRYAVGRKDATIQPVMKEINSNIVSFNNWDLKEFVLEIDKSIEFFERIIEGSKHEHEWKIKELDDIRTHFFNVMADRY